MHYYVIVSQPRQQAILMAHTYTYSPKYMRVQSMTISHEHKCKHAPQKQTRVHTHSLSLLNSLATGVFVRDATVVNAVNSDHLVRLIAFFR